uniref:Uncharacterized protein n=1 Tax=Amphimedon queenslandica TaxID=400682 RepID=A0A1X7UD00_AMPQE
MLHSVIEFVSQTLPNLVKVYDSVLTKKLLHQCRSQLLYFYVVHLKQCTYCTMMSNN